MLVVDIQEVVMSPLSTTVHGKYFSSFAIWHLEHMDGPCSVNLKCSNRKVKNRQKNRDFYFLAEGLYSLRTVYAFFITFGQHKIREIFR